MSGFTEGLDRDQVSLFPRRPEDRIDEDHLVRVGGPNDKNFTNGKIARRLAHPEADVERCITGMVRIDRQEEGAARAGKVAHPAQRYGRVTREIEKLKAMDKALADAPDGRISLTDPDARAMATSARNSGLVGCNAQCAVDTETHVIVTHDVTNKGFDPGQLGPMAIAAKEAPGRDELHALAAGVFQGWVFQGWVFLGCRDCRPRQGWHHAHHAAPRNLRQSHQGHVCEVRLQI